MQNYDEEILRNLRRRMFIISMKHGVTHLASAFSSLEIFYALYEKGALRIKKDDLLWEERDRFILSKGHAAIGMYAVMEHAGILEKDELDTFLMPGTRLAGEPCRRNLPLTEASTGSLGHGLSLGLGMALAQKMRKSDARTIVLLGDGECQEGSVWEAAMGAAAHKADNLIAILDCNQIQKMGTTEETMGCVRWQQKWKDFGWLVEEVNGHDVDEICRELSKKNDSGMPKIIIAHTIKGHGVSIMENNAAWHYKEPKKKEIKAICEELGIPMEEVM